jgi:uncharacterized membrane protein YoaK (UPF0700 family)
VSPSSPVPRRLSVVLLLTLTGVTGLVDAVSYLRLGHVFVANMTGNVVFLGLGVNPHSGLSPWTSLTALGGFLLGAVAGGRAVRHLGAGQRSWLVVPFAVQATIIAAVALLFGLGAGVAHGNGRYAAIAVLALALGIQNSTVRHLSAPDLTTTVLTMTLTGLAADSFLAGGSGARPIRRFGSVVVMCTGAVVGAALLEVSVTPVIAIAATLVGVVALGFCFGPLAVAETPGVTGPSARAPD